ncbi:MAG: hypothetical protein ACD_64C00322G0003 [uncultured bacterium]|nr:MAG: hypothetical protein ACD_64C00322G0003 [uncultured bacterium]
MDIFIVISLIAIIAWIIALYKNPTQWNQYVQYMPIVFFMLYVQANGLTHDAWVHAFTASGLLAIGSIVLSVQQRVLMDRLFLGVNFFLLLGSAAFSFNIAPFIKWYSATNSGPFFSCIAMVGVLTTLCTPTGFLGKKGVNAEAARYGSFLLLAATFVALIWSVQQDAQGILWAVIAPLLVLVFLQYQMKQHIS